MAAETHLRADNYWDRSKVTRAPGRKIDCDVSVDVAIVGAGYTGLSTAYHLKAADPSLNVAVLESETVGYGASGRNAGFVMTLFGASLGLMKTLHGAEKVRAAHAHMERSIAALETMLEEHALDCDYQRSGFLKVATTPRYAARIRDEIATLEALGIHGHQWIGPEELSARVHSPTYLGAMVEPGCGLINPRKWVDGLAGVAQSAGAKIYENSPVKNVRREGGRFRLESNGATVTAEKVVFASNGYTHLIPGMRLKQLPAFVFIVVTEPLSEAQRASIGWAGREGVEDGRNFMHFYRLTPDNRLLMGGGPGFVPLGGRMNHDTHPAAWRHLEEFIATTFPGLAGIKIAHRWGGAFSVTADSTPQIGTLHGGAAAYSVGCTGHGVALAHMNGRILRDLILDKKTDLTDLWFVNRRSLPLPPEPIGSLGAKAVTAAMALDDWWCDRGATQP
ncbi:FAD-dependent oxidoreductase [Hyphomicrobium sp. NDB2Meth4]|uniref:NAD(P)/FAD-dependent oxidoreductase n=1 Tax=Hyphomicrobium sp. NDB2Meth4 TaxID=1892846 RepID=UPI000930BF68|nr:FAD-dependent oxidoreductase [Hyphomicrobium sp. NDB2Meth4]